LSTRPVRVPAQPPEEWSDVTRAAFAGVAPTASGRRPLHLPAVVARHPTLLEPYMTWATAVARRGVLDARTNTLLALRTALRCRSEFEWGVHATYAGERAGLTGEEIARVVAGPGAPGWSAREAALLRLADELHDNDAVGDDTWAALSTELGADGLLEAVFVVGHYTMLSMVANSAGVPPEPDWASLPG
jgi:alkylhydroperoxidase/carboxymuconolactone decarboxylase family protein YurZ